MQFREFAYVGENRPTITMDNGAAFLQQYQIAILSSLQKRGLLNRAQCERCIEELDRDKCGGRAGGAG